MPSPSRARALLGAAVVAIALDADAAPLLHERIPPDPRDDIAMRVTLDGNLPAAIETPSGLVSAPDPRRPVRPGRSHPPSAGGRFDAAAAGKYEADTDTRRPDLLPYDEPFTPSTAPFKRLVAFDAVDSAFRLVVSDPTLRPLVVDDSAGPSASEESFFADIVVVGAGDRPVRIPSVGPGARVRHARMGSGARDFDYKLWRDGADNWFVQTNEVGRLVMEVSVPRAAFGGDLGDPLLAELHVPPLPPEVLGAANIVASAIRLDRTSPRRTLIGLVSYFRSFTDSNDPPSGHGNAYLDLALSKKGVCRHRAYAFMITALGLGIPTRMVMNEAHAWVEVDDGSLWRRIDLGGAGRTLDAPRDAAIVPYEPPPDPYAWPPNAETGEDLGRNGPAASRSGGAGAAPSATPSSPSAGPSAGVPATAARITLEVQESDLRRGAPVNVRGTVDGGGDPCARVTVEVALRGAKKARPLPVGSLATDDLGRFAGVLIVPFDVPAGDYDVVAHSAAATGCAEGFSR
jgi:transglutaminase-like putative cysteine protease